MFLSRKFLMAALGIPQPQAQPAVPPPQTPQGNAGTRGPEGHDKRGMPIWKGKF
jgi:hypothetical protein